MKNNTETEEKELINKMIVDPELRSTVTKASHYWFFHLYFAHYVSYRTADFQREMFSITENPRIKHAYIVAFRGSGKSTIMNLSYPIWSILGKEQRKFVVILGQTQKQARQHLMNIRSELEDNDLLRSDLGPFKEESDEWGSFSLVIPKYGARIMAASAEQSIRGIRHKQHRPDLMICDDIEDMASAKTKEGRDKTYNWLTGEVFPAGDRNTKLIIIGNLLHEDSVLMRLKERMVKNDSEKVFKQYPLLNDKGKILWPGKYPDETDIEREKRNTENEVAWQREFLLRIVPDSGQVIHPEWIGYYDELPPEKGTEFRFTATGIDLAVSEKTSADYTAMVSGKVYGYGDNVKIYILPNPINERMSAPQTIDRAKILSKALGNGRPTKLFVENFGTQEFLTQQLLDAGYPATGSHIPGDKRAKLSNTAPLIFAKRVLFPRKGAEELINQLINFQVEKYDDLADAFVILVLEVIAGDNKKPVMPEIMVIPWPDITKRRGLSDDWDD